jgi:hypothetical protein
MFPIEWNPFLTFIVPDKCEYNAADLGIDGATIVKIKELDVEYTEVDYIYSTYPGNINLNFLHISGVVINIQEYKRQVQEKIFEKFRSDNIFTCIKDLKNWIFNFFSNSNDETEDECFHSHEEKEAKIDIKEGKDVDDQITHKSKEIFFT